MKCALFSGRFDPPHLGHVMTIGRLMRSHDIVFVPILHYADRHCSAIDAQRIFETFHDMYAPRFKSAGTVVYVIDTVHFGEATRQHVEQLLGAQGAKIEDTTYYTGNPQVLKHMHGIMESKHIDRIHISDGMPIDQQAMSGTILRQQDSKTVVREGDIYEVYGHTTWKVLGVWRDSIAVRDHRGHHHTVKMASVHSMLMTGDMALIKGVHSV